MINDEWLLSTIQAQYMKRCSTTACSPAFVLSMAIKGRLLQTFVDRDSLHRPGPGSTCSLTLLNHDKIACVLRQITSSCKGGPCVSETIT
jgi:hypothetical protein